MQNSNSKYKQELKNRNIIGNEDNPVLLEFQTELGIALRGGSLPMIVYRSGVKRLVNPINFLNKDEKRELIFSANINYN